MNLPAQRVGVVILAAGSSSRMGRPKLLLPWGETTVLGHQIRIWQALGAGQIAVVCAAADDGMRAELDHLGFPAGNRILNPQPELGMFSSICCASQWPGWVTGLTNWAIMLGDQPHLRPETLQALLAFSAKQPTSVCQPRYTGRLRHPVILSKEAFLRLRDAGCSTLREFLLSLPEEPASCDIDDPGLHFDIDTPADYKRVLALYSKAE